MTQPSTAVPEWATRALSTVFDPCCREKGISVIDMGLLRSVAVHDGHARVELLLTSGWCPFVASMSSAIPDRLRAVDGVETCDVRVVWDPVWTMERLSPSAREKLAMPLHELEPYREQRLAATERT